MPDADGIERFNEIIQEVAGDLFQIIETSPGIGAPWQSAYADIRFSPSGGAQSAKFRVQLQDGKLESLKITGRISMLLDDAWELQGELFPDKWYGVKYTLMPDGQCKTEFNYDPDCLGDPAFFDD